MQLRTDLREELQTSLGGAFEIERELGGGGMSRVFVARETALDRRVVVKVLPPELSGMNVERFRREIHLAAQLAHPHIVPVHASGETNGVPYYTMPYIDGRTLRDRLEAGLPIPLAETLRILQEVAGALSYAHARGVVHRDIKPENILLSAGHAVVMDFGVAKALSAANASGPRSMVLETGAGIAIGTPAYMAPEQAAGDPNTDHRADIYAFGLLAYELLAGRGPFGRRPPHEMLTAQVSEQPRHIRELNPEISERLASLVMSCLEKQPARRPESAALLQQELAAITTSGASTAVIPFTFRGWRRWSAAAVVLLAAAGTLAGIMRPTRAVREDLVAVAPFRVTSTDPSLRYLREGMLDLLSMKLTGSGGPRSADPRALLSAWRRAAGSDTAPLPRERAIALAEGLGAAHLLLGEIGGTAQRLILSAALIQVTDGRSRGQVRVEGPADSLPALVDRLTTQLLAHRAGESERLASLTSTSLDAVRAYLDGQALYRRAHYRDAAERFAQALQMDSTFALAGLGLASAASWFGDPAQRMRGIAVAWRERARLGPRDRALLDLRAGPRYPEPPTALQMLTAAERYLALAPERADAWFDLGDALFHYGPSTGRSDAHQRAADAFRRTLQMDSTYLPAAEHLVILDARMGDTAAVRRVAELYLRTDPNNNSADAVRWVLAAAIGDQRLRGRALARRDSMSDISMHTIQQIAQLTGLDLQAADSVTAWMVRNSIGKPMESSIVFGAYDYALNRGRPAEALRILDRLRGIPRVPPQQQFRDQIRGALFGDGDTLAAVAAARQLAARTAGGPPAAKETRLHYHPDLCMLERWKVGRGDTSTVRSSIARLATSDESFSSMRAGCVLTLEAQLAALQRRPDLRRHVERLDSLMQTAPVAAVRDPGNLIVARLWESLGEPARALAAVRRREFFISRSLFLSSFYREEARLATLVGDTQGAIIAWKRYVALRSAAEPALQAELQRARQALARLEGSSSVRS